MQFCCRPSPYAGRPPPAPNRTVHAHIQSRLTANGGTIVNASQSFARWFVSAVAGLLCVLLMGGPVGDAAAQPKPEGEMRWALYVTLSPMWFDPGEYAGLTPFWVLYAIHDALVKPMPGNLMTPSLAESWTVSADQRVYEFKLREGLRFHNGDPFTAEDVRFSFHRAKGSKVLHDKVREIAIVDPYRVRFHLHDPWPDFMTFYGTLVRATISLTNHGPGARLRVWTRQPARPRPWRKRSATSPTRISACRFWWGSGGRSAWCALSAAAER